MTSKAQRAANARNALRSTGPTSADGRNRSSANAVKHGGFSSRIDPVVASILREDPDELQAFHDALVEDLAPVSPLQLALAENVAIRIINGRRVSRLMSPLAGNCQLTPDEQDRIGRSREEVRFACSLLDALDVIEGVSQSEIHWLQVIVDVQQRVSAGAGYGLGRVWADGEHRGPIGEIEWRCRFLELIELVFDDLADARSYGEGRIGLYGPGADEEHRQASALEARRLLEEFERGSRLHERIDRGLARALDVYQSFRGEQTQDG